jgi:DNA-binding transcriptional ArsR family regulator
VNFRIEKIPGVTMAEQRTESQITVIRNAILDFLEVMKQEKREVEQQIRERTENLRSQFLASGASQFSYSDVDNFGRQYKDEFLDFYKNIMHLKLVASASGRIRVAVESALVDSGVVKEEWVKKFNSMEEQIAQYDDFQSKVEEYEGKILEQQELLNQLSEGASLHSEDYEVVQAQLAEKDQLLIEKDEEVMNLNEGMLRMENQANTLGQQMLSNTMMIEELQSTIGEKDDEITVLNNAIASYSENASETEVLREQLRQSQLREQELQTQVGSASSDIVDQLQGNLEKTRTEVLDIRRELVTKSEEIHQLKLEKEEFDVKTKRKDEQVQGLKEENRVFREEKSQVDQTITELKQSNSSLQEEKNKFTQELETTSSKLITVEQEYSQAKLQLDQFEGKQAISVEEQDKRVKEIEDLKLLIDQSDKAISYFKNILTNDIKFRTLLYLDSLSNEIRIDDLATGVGVPQETIHRALIELSNAGLCTTRKEGRFIVALPGDTKSPLQLESLQS